jgi:hypothetical protein
MPRFEKGSKEAKEWGEKMRASRGKKMSGGAVAPPSRLPESSPAAEMVGGKVKIGKAFSKGIKALNKANPIMLAIKDKKARGAMTTSGDIAYNYALPAAVEVGKPALDAAAMAASTAVTGNPLAGKVLVDTLWDKMVAEKGYDPRQRQRSQLLGSVSKEAGKVAGQETRAKLGKGMCMECPECKGMGIKMSAKEVSGGMIKMKDIESVEGELRKYKDLFETIKLQSSSKEEKREDLKELVDELRTKQRKWASDLNKEGSEWDEVMIEVLQDIGFFISDVMKEANKISGGKVGIDRPKKPMPPRNNYGAVMENRVNALRGRIEEITNAVDRIEERGTAITRRDQQSLMRDVDRAMSEMQSIVREAPEIEPILRPVFNHLDLLTRDIMNLLSSV